jgi:hypothetical protein
MDPDLATGQASALHICLPAGWLQPLKFGQMELPSD